jgi:hypothetical protein
MRVSKLVTWIGIWFAFCNVVWAMDQSFLIKSQDSIEHEYLEVVDEWEKDSSRPFFYYISKKPSYRWPPLVSQSFKDEAARVTTADLLFAINHRHLAKKDEKHKSLFELAIIDRLLHKKLENQNAMILLLTKPSIKKEINWWTSEKAEVTLLAACIEDGHLDVLKALLDAWPKNTPNPFDNTALNVVTRVKDPQKQGLLWSGYSDKTQSYTIVQWLVRLEAYYLKGSYAKQNYRDAATLIVNFVQARGYNYEELAVFKPFLPDINFIESKKEDTSSLETQHVIQQERAIEVEAVESKEEAPKSEILHEDQILDGEDNSEEAPWLERIFENMAHFLN